MSHEFPGRPRRGGPGTQRSLTIRILAVFLLSWAAWAGGPKAGDPRLYFGGDSIGVIRMNGDEILVDYEVGGPAKAQAASGCRYGVTVNNAYVPVTDSDFSRSLNWMNDHDQKYRLAIRRGDLYLDGVRIDLNGVEVAEIFQALPWGNGILCIGRTYLKKPRERLRLIADLFKPSAEGAEPCHAVWIDPLARRGKTRWLYGKARKNFFVFPVPGR